MKHLLLGIFLFAFVSSYAQSDSAKAKPRFYISANAGGFIGLERYSSPPAYYSNNYYLPSSRDLVLGTKNGASFNLNAEMLIPKTFFGLVVSTDYGICNSDSGKFNMYDVMIGDVFHFEEEKGFSCELKIMGGWAVCKTPEISSTGTMYSTFETDGPTSDSYYAATTTGNFYTKSINRNAFIFSIGGDIEEAISKRTSFVIAFGFTDAFFAYTVNTVVTPLYSNVSGYDPLHGSYKYTQYYSSGPTSTTIDNTKWYYQTLNGTLGVTYKLSK